MDQLRPKLGRGPRTKKRPRQDGHWRTGRSEADEWRQGGKANHGRPGKGCGEHEAQQARRRSCRNTNCKRTGERLTQKHVWLARKLGPYQRLQLLISKRAIRRVGDSSRGNTQRAQGLAELCEECRGAIKPGKNHDGSHVAYWSLTLELSGGRRRRPPRTRCQPALPGLDEKSCSATLRPRSSPCGVSQTDLFLLAGFSMKSCA